MHREPDPKTCTNAVRNHPRRQPSCHLPTDPVRIDRFTNAPHYPGKLHCPNRGYARPLLRRRIEATKHTLSKQTSYLCAAITPPAVNDGGVLIHALLQQLTHGGGDVLVQVAGKGLNQSPTPWPRAEDRQESVTHSKATEQDHLHGKLKGGESGFRNLCPIALQRIFLCGGDDVIQDLRHSVSGHRMSRLCRSRCRPLVEMGLQQVMLQSHPTLPAPLLFRSLGERRHGQFPSKRHLGLAGQPDVCCCQTCRGVSPAAPLQQPCGRSRNAALEDLSHAIEGHQFMAIGQHTFS